jgi:hypothetical protein
MFHGFGKSTTIMSGNHRSAGFELEEHPWMNAAGFG